MVSVFCTLIINKRKMFDDVPAKLKDQVKERLEELGYDTNGDQITTA